METRVIKLADIKPAPYNPRVQLTPKDQEYKALDASIEENGLVLPLIVNIRDNCLIGGHQRLSVLLAAGETETNAVVVDMPEAQAKALCIALNKLDGEWDYGQLADIIQQLIDDGESLLATGFTQADIDDLLGKSAASWARMRNRPPWARKRTPPTALSVPWATSLSVWRKRSLRTLWQMSGKRWALPRSLSVRS